MPPTAPVDTQPTLARFSLRGLLALPRRLCSPPPAVGSVRSFGLTPILDVTLDDVLARRHLPPLSLKDFEEWLLFVEGNAHYLYFLLCVREYTARYNRWIRKVRARDARRSRRPANAFPPASACPGARSPPPGSGSAPSSSPSAAHSYRAAWSTTLPTSPSLALFFARTLDTFLSPGSPHALALPPELATHAQVLRARSAHALPDPVALANLRLHAEDALRASLRRCVRAALTNVGAYRATCGVVGGGVIVLGGCAPILADNVARAGSRWARLAIVPPLWLGLTVVLASLCGVCMMIYVFGDLRQLRHFELARPPAREADAQEGPVSSSAYAAAPIQALTAPPKLPHVVVRFPAKPLPVHQAQPAALSPIPEACFPACTSLDTRPVSTGGISISAQLGVAHAHGNLRQRDSAVSDDRSVPAYLYPDSDDDSCFRVGAQSHSRPSSAHLHSQLQRTARKGGARYGYGYATASEDGGSRFDAEDEDVDDDCSESESEYSDFDDHGIYISPSMPAPEALAEDDPAVVSAALALLAHSRAIALAQQGSGSLLDRDGFASDEREGKSGRRLPTAPPPEAVGGAETAPTSPAARTGAHPQPALPQTAPFIPAESESGAYTASSHSHSHSHSHSRGPSPKLGPFDFDALPRPLQVHVRAAAEKAGHGHARSDAVSDAEKGYGYGYGEAESTQSRCASRQGGPADADADASVQTPVSEAEDRDTTTPTSSCAFFTHLHRPSSEKNETEHEHEKGQGLEGAATVGRSSTSTSTSTSAARLPSVRAFGPTTAVREPVVARAHWEVVVRSAGAAALLCAAVCVCVVACPVPSPSSSAS